jgi:hypothetical protein
VYLFETQETIVYANWIFADRNFRLTGGFEEDYYEEIVDLNFRKGWNVVYLIANYNMVTETETLTITTRRPANVELEWVFFNFNNFSSPFATRAKSKRSVNSLFAR